MVWFSMISVPVQYLCMDFLPEFIIISNQSALLYVVLTGQNHLVCDLEDNYRLIEYVYKYTCTTVLSEKNTIHLQAKMQKLVICMMKSNPLQFAFSK